jgi:hypothetical protein
MHRLMLLNPPTFGFLIGTRAALAFGAGLLVAGKLSDSRRRALGRGLVAGGIATTIPAAFLIRRSIHAARTTVPAHARGAGIEQDDRLRSVERFPRKGDDVF